MSKRSYNVLAIYGVAVLTLAAPAAADYPVVDNIAFNARKINPYTGGPAFVLSREVDIFKDLSIRADIPPLNANPLGIALEALFGISLPEIVKLQVGATLAGRTNVSAGYYVSAGRLDISYPASSSLNFQTLPGTTNVVRANDSFRVDGVFQPGVSQRTVLPQFLEMEGGAGYFTSPLRTQTAYQEPWFETQSPWASAWIDASADIQAGVHTKASVLFGLKSWRKDFRGGGQVGGRLVEIDPNGLYVAGEEILGFDLTQPIGPIPVPGPGGPANLTIQVPNLAVSSGPQSGAVIHARKQQPLMTLTGNLEKLIPFIGPILQNSIGPLGYDLLNLSGGPQIELYQDMTFTPDPKLRLTFSEPVLFGNDPVPAFVREFDLDENIYWTPMFSNSTSITVKPTYLLNNTFQNETGLAVSLLVDVEALSLTGNFPPFNGTLGPIYDTTINVPLFDGKLFEQNFNIPLGSVQGGSIPGIGPITTTGITFQKLNLDIEFGLGDLKFDDAVFLHEDDDNPGYDIYNLSFSRTVEGGGTPRQYEATVSARQSNVTPEGGGEGDEANFFESLPNVDIIATDVDANEQFNLGRYVCYAGCNQSEFLPTSSPAYVDPNPLLGTLYVNTLPDDLTTVPGVDLDPTGHPVLDRYSSDGDFRIDESIEYATEIIDLREGPSTTILVRTGEFVPESDAQISFVVSRPVMNDAGSAVFIAYLDTIPGDSYGIYLADGSGLDKAARNGDPLPSGVEIISDLGDFGVRNLNNSGQALFRTSLGGFSSVIVRTESDGSFTEVARTGQAVPEGGGSLGVLSDGPINEAGQVSFSAFLQNPLQPLEKGIYVGDGQSLTKIVRTGDSLPGLSVPVYFLYDSFAFNDNGEVAFTAQGFPDEAGIPEAGIYIGDGNTITPIVFSGNAAPNGDTFAILGTPEINNERTIAFHAYVDTPAQGQLQGVYMWDGNQILEIAINAGQQFGPSVYSPTLNERGDVAFGATRGIYLHDGSALQPIVVYGQMTPDGAGRFQSDADFTTWRLNNEGQIAFAFDVLDINLLRFHNSIFVHDGTSLVEVARTGQELAGSVITQLNLGDLNDEMQIAYHAYLADGRQVIARFEPSLYWRNLGSGTWAAGSNWSLGFEPRNPYDVFIIAENALMVTGPAVNRTVKSLSIGGDDTATATLNLTSGVTLTATNGTTVRANGVVTGFGTLAGSVTNQGTISPGASPGILHIDGDFTQSSTGTLLIEMASPTSYDQLLVTGDVTLGGTLSVSLLGGFLPAEGQTFAIFGDQLDAIAGAFGSIVFPTFNGLTFAVSQSLNSISLQVVESIGDFNTDGAVDAADYVVWRDGLGTIYTQTDYDTWRSHFGQTAGSAAGTTVHSAPGSAEGSAAIPEPSTFLLAILSLVGAVAYTRRRSTITHPRCPTAAPQPLEDRAHRKAG